MNISRRAILGGIAAIPATAAPGSALTPPEAPDIGRGPQSAPAAALSPAELLARLQELCDEASDLLRLYGDGNWLAEISPAGLPVPAMALRRRAGVDRAAALYEVREPSGIRIVVAKPVGDFVLVSSDVAAHEAGRGYLQARARFERRIIRKVGELA